MDAPNPKNKFLIVLKTATKGTRFDSDPGDIKRISWRGQEIPRIVLQARAGAAIDWGGAMVRASEYAVILDQPTKTTQEPTP
jgi:hypothetical protein